MRHSGNLYTRDTGAYNGYRATELQSYRATGLQGYRAAGLQGCRATGLQGYRGGRDTKGVAGTVRTGYIVMAPFGRVHGILVMAY